MAERGLYACYGFVLGFAFAVLGLVLAVSVVRTQGAARHGSQSTIRKTVLRILIIAFPVALCFAVIFIFTVLEIATHRHGARYEYYITSYLCTECVALGFMLFHFISAGMKARAARACVYVCLRAGTDARPMAGGQPQHRLWHDGLRRLQAGQQGRQRVARRQRHQQHGRHLGYGRWWLIHCTGGFVRGHRVGAGHTCAVK